ncbi:hypothetical protein [Pseudomonas putida]
MRVTEEDVVRMASLSANRNGRDELEATIAALETIEDLKQQFSGKPLMDALESLYRQYENGAQD